MVRQCVTAIIDPDEDGYWIAESPHLAPNWTSLSQGYTVGRKLVC